jgi:hypothetical protein
MVRVSFRVVRGFIIFGNKFGDGRSVLCLV